LGHRRDHRPGAWHGAVQAHVREPRGRSEQGGRARAVADRRRNAPPGSMLRRGGSFSEDGALRVVSPGHAAFAAVMIALGVQGLITGEFTAVWQPVPKGVPAREALVYVCALISIACGAGLLWKRTSGPAAR